MNATDGQVNGIGTTSLRDVDGYSRNIRSLSARASNREDPAMPAPDYLLPILNRLGDGGTVAIAEVVHQMVEDARAEGAADALRQANATPADPTTEPVEPQEPVSAGSLLVREAAASVALDGETVALPAAPSEEPAASDADEGAFVLGDDAASDDQNGAAHELQPVGDDLDWGDEDERDTDRPHSQPGADPTNAEVRAWCKDNGVAVNDRGAVRADARAAYDAAHSAV